MRTRSLISAIFISMVVMGAAHAHNALVPHEHPHGVSAFAGIEILLTLLALPLAAYVAYRYVRRS